MDKLSSKQKIEKFLFRLNGKYLIIGTCMAIIHTVYLIFFQRIGLYSMMAFNLISIAGYLYYAAEAYRGNRIRDFFYFLVIEVPLHGIVTTIMIGWDFRFMLVVTGCITCVFYFIIFIDKFKRSILIPTLIGSLYSALYIAVRIYTDFNAPIFTITKNAEVYQTFFTYFNTIVSFIAVVFFNALTAIEYNYVRMLLISENSKLDTFATYDTLTGLLNRRSADKKLKLIYDANYYDEDSFSVIMCDIDHFKIVNDTYGHDTGDYVLKEVARIIKSQIRENDTVGRWGGEEFLIIVNDQKAGALKLAERIRANVEANRYFVNGKPIKVTMTFGVSSHHPGTDMKGLIKSADQKLYRGKSNGRNQVVS